MATKKCPYCGGEIKAVARKCRYCGTWLDGTGDNAKAATPGGSEETTEQAPSPDTNAASDDNGDTARPLMMCLILAGILIFTIIIAEVVSGSASDKNDDATSNLYTEEETTEETIKPVYETYQYTSPQEECQEVENYTSEDEEGDYNSVSNINRYKKELQGVYLLHNNGFMDDDEIRRWGKYVISGDKLIYLVWDDDMDEWRIEYTATYTLKYIDDNYYMTGYNIIYQDPNGTEYNLCCGDTDQDGVMDLWCSDSTYYSKQ